MTITIVLWVGLLGIIVLGIPIGFSMYLMSMVTIFYFTKTNNIVIAQKAVNGLDSFPLLAVPFFMMAATIMSETGVGHKIFDFAGSLVRHLRGGLGHVNIMASVIMAGMSGSAVSDVTGIGKLEIEAMEKAGFDRSFSAAVTAASSTIGPIIPPSIAMVVYGSIAGVSTGRLLIGGAVPGLLMALLMMVVVYVVSVRRNYPKLPRASLSELSRSFVRSIPALLMPVILLGGIIGGFMTPTEAACVSTLYAIFLGMFFYRNLGIHRLFELLKNCTSICASTMFVISSASVFGLVLTTQQIPQKMVAFLTGLSDNPNVILFAINILLLILGCVLEGTSIFIILTPIIAALAKPLGIDPIHLGVLVVFNVTIGLLTPPVGMCMFLTCKVAKVTSKDFLREAWPFLMVLLIALGAITYIPAISVWLPNLLMS